MNGPFGISYRRTDEQTLAVLLDNSVASPSGCREWSGLKNKHGYGRIRFQGRCRLAHRVRYLITVGPIADGMAVCHKCDNPACIEPAHLFIGTAKDNIHDAMQKGRHVAPPIGAHAKLTVAQVVSIREARKRGVKRAVIAGEFGTSAHYISKICNRRIWGAVA